MLRAADMRAGATAQPRVLIAALLFAATLAAAAGAHGARMVVLLALGLLLGATLFLASFGFASAYRRLIEERDATSVRAQLLMLAAATLLFSPVLAQNPDSGAVAPAGVGVAVGAFLFGVGMQLAGGCGSGALYTMGGGHLRMAVVLAAFIAGSFWASLHTQSWSTLPAFEARRLGDIFGWPAAVTVQSAVFAALYVLAGRLGRPRAGASMRALAGGALTLAVLNVLTLIVAGHPWSITWAFTLWGAKVARALGWDPAGDAFWGEGFQREALEASVFADTTSVMDLGLVLGAFAVAGTAGAFRLRHRISAGAALTAALGGLAMGYGARIAYGCNIGAFFSGVASTSLHGWLWIAAALPGCWLGLKLSRSFAAA